MAYELTWEKQTGVVKRFDGYVTADEIARATVETQGDMRFDDLRYVINDFLACTEYVDDIKVIDEIAATDGAASLYNKKLVVAIVTTMPEIKRAAERYAKSSFHPNPASIFTTLADARGWIAEMRRLEH